MGGVSVYSEETVCQGLHQIKEKILTNEEEFNHFLARGFMEMPVFRMKRRFPDEIKKASGAKRVIVASKVKLNMRHDFLNCTGKKIFRM